MPLDVRKRRAEDEMREFWQLEVAENSPTIMDGTVDKLHSDVQFPLSVPDAKAVMSGLVHFLAEMGAMHPQIASDILDVMALG